MKKAAIILAILGAMNLTGLSRIFDAVNNPRWPLTLLASILGTLLLSVAVGIWLRWIFAWHLGFVALALGSVYFVVGVFFMLPAVSVNEKVIILISCFIGAILVAAYWSVIWYRQKKWFLTNPH